MSTFCTYRNLCWLLLAVAVVWGLSACDLLGSSDNGEEEIIDLPGKVVFSTKAEDGNNQIFTINADGSNLTQRTFQNFEFDDSPQSNFMGLHPAWGPNGDKILFNTSTGHSSMEIWILSPDNKNTGYTIFDEHGAQVLGNHPKWKPDGSQITFFGPQEWNDNPFIYTFSSQEVASLGHYFSDTNFGSDPPPAFWHPAWSPDGNKLAFFSTLDEWWNIYVGNADGTGLKKVSELQYHTPVSLVWHPCGNFITFHAKSDDVTSGLYNLNLETGELSVIVGQDDSGLILHPKAWSGDGNFLLVNNRSDQSNHVLEILEVNDMQLYEVYAATSIIEGADWFIEESSN